MWSEVPVSSAFQLIYWCVYKMLSKTTEKKTTNEIKLQRIDYQLWLWCDWIRALAPFLFVFTFFYVIHSHLNTFENLFIRERNEKKQNKTNNHIRTAITDRWVNVCISVLPYPSMNMSKNDGQRIERSFANTKIEPTYAQLV